MKIHSFPAIIFSCLLVTSLMIPAGAFPDTLGSRNRSLGSANPALWSDDDGEWFTIWHDENKKLQCTGLDNKGQCDIPRELVDIKTGLFDVHNVAIGSDFVVALLENGSVVVWGSNDHGQRNVPPNLTNVIQLTVTTTGSVAALMDNGTVISWGYNNQKQTEVPSILANNVTYVVGAYSHFVALTREKTIVAWGDNSLGQCDVPAGMENIIDVAVGRYHTLALAENGTVFAWGYNWWGPCNISPNIGKVREISSGQDSSLLYLENGTVLVTGSTFTSAGEPGPGLYPSIAETNFNTEDTMVRDNIAITDRGDVLIVALPEPRCPDSEKFR